MKKTVILTVLLTLLAFAAQQIQAETVSGNYIYKDSVDVAKISVKEKGNGVFSLATEYANPSSLRTCEYEGLCRIYNNKLVCISDFDIGFAKDMGIDPSEKQVELLIQKNGLKLVKFTTSYCTTAIPEGLYRKVKK